MKFERNPSIAPKQVTEFTSQEYYDYVKGLYVAPETKSPGSQITFKKTKTGKLSLTIRRKPKWVMWSELNDIAKENNVSMSDLFVMLKHKRKEEVLIFTDEKQKEKVLSAIKELDEGWPVGQEEDDDEGSDDNAD